MTDTDALEREIEEKRRSISAEGYPMSIGELTNLYRDGDLVIRPEFQRFFRWSSPQKSRLVESILLGIPLPSVFVAQNNEGIWEVVDGLQRISTILELQGELIGREGVRLPFLELEETDYLPSLGGRIWDDKDYKKSLSPAQRRDVKRTKLDLKIIQRESSPETKFDLFRRLNNYGSSLSAAEMRSALLVAVSSEFFAWLERLSSHSSFLNTVQLSERLLDERYDLELVIRFLVLHNRPNEKLTLSALRDLPTVLDNEAIRIAKEFDAISSQLDATFKTTFDLVEANGGADIFSRYDQSKNEFSRAFLNTAFEVMALGLGYHVRNGTAHRTDLRAAAIEFWQQPKMQKGFATGRSTEARLREFVPEGRSLLAA